MPKDRLIFLLRHGKILAENMERRYIGHIDIPLSPEGLEQAHFLQAQLAKEKLAAVFCSDLIRSVNTAKIITEKLPITPIIRRDLREISMGDWEGKTFKEIRQLYPVEYSKRGQNIINYRIPGAESFAECKTRVLTAFTDLINTTSGTILIVGHAGINRILLCHILGMPLENLFHFKQDYGCINILEYKSSQYQLTLLNGHVLARSSEN